MIIMSTVTMPKPDTPTHRRQRVVLKAFINNVVTYTLYCNNSPLLRDYPLRVFGVKGGSVK